jgi:hypothetical protein
MEDEPRQRAQMTAQFFANATLYIAAAAGLAAILLVFCNRVSWSE